MPLGIEGGELRDFQEVELIRLTDGADDGGQQEDMSRMTTNISGLGNLIEGYCLIEMRNVENRFGRRNSFDQKAYFILPGRFC